MHVLYLHLWCLCLAAFVCVYPCLRCVCMCMCAAACASVITCPAVIPQIAEDALAKARPCRSRSLPWRGSRARQIWAQVLTLTQTHYKWTRLNEKARVEVAMGPASNGWNSQNMRYVFTSLTAASVLKQCLDCKVLYSSFFFPNPFVV